MEMTEVLIRFVIPILLPIAIFNVLSYTHTAISYDRYDKRLALVSILITLFFILLGISNDEIMQYFVAVCFGYASLVSNTRGARTASLVGLSLGLYLLASASYKDADEKNPCQQTQPQSTEFQKTTLTNNFSNLHRKS